MRLTKADHHVQFLSKCRDANVVPSGLRLKLSLNLMDGPLKAELEASISNILSEQSKDFMLSVISYYECLCDSEQKVLTDLNRELSHLHHSLTDNEEDGYRDKITQRQDRLSEQLTLKREKKLKALKDPSVRQQSRKKATKEFIKKSSKQLHQNRIKRMDNRRSHESDKIHSKQSNIRRTNHQHHHSTNLQGRDSDHFPPVYPHNYRGPLLPTPLLPTLIQQATTAGNQMVIRPHSVLTTGPGPPGNSLASLALCLLILANTLS